MKKRIICLVLAAFLVLSLFAGCKKKSAAKQAAATTSPSQATAQATQATVSSSAASGNSSGKSVSGSSADDRHIKEKNVKIAIPNSWKKDTDFKYPVIAQISNTQNSAAMQVEINEKNEYDVKTGASAKAAVLNIFYTNTKTGKVETETRWNKSVGKVFFSGNFHGINAFMNIYTVNIDSTQYIILCFAQNEADFKNTDFNQVLNAISFD